MRRDVIPRIRAWLFDAALPVWMHAGMDRAHGGPLESLDIFGRGPSGAVFKRSRVCARQIYVMSHASLLLAQVPGREEQAKAAREAALELFAYYQRVMWRGPQDGWLRRSTQDGAPLDATPDLYDYAFALFALGWFYRATRDAHALALAQETLDILEARFRHPNGWGFHHELPPALPRQQNPHMHLCEASLVLAEEGKSPRFAALADELADLFVKRLVRMPDGVLLEFFDADWNPIAGERGLRVEPGHQFEWAWILAQHQRLSGTDHSPVIEAMVHWAERHGVDPHTQGVFNAVQEDGAPIDRGSRTWPNTERMKGWIGAHEALGLDPWPALEGSAGLLLDRYLSTAPNGMWIDAFDAHGAPIATEIPTSTFYHLFLAFAETLRVAQGEDL